jgi:hypothetical protein
MRKAPNTINTIQKSISIFISLHILFVHGNYRPQLMRLCLRCLLHRAASCRVKPRFRRLLSGHFRRCPVPAIVFIQRQRMTAAPFNDRIDGFPDSIQQPHLCYRRDIGTLSVPPQVKDRFRHRRSRLPCVVQRKGVHVPVQCPDVGRRPLCDTEAVGECRRSNVPQVNRIAVPFRSFTAFGIKDNRYCFPDCSYCA